MDQLRIIKQYRSEKDPDLQSNEGNSISACSRDDLEVIAKKINLPLDDILAMLNEDDSRENIVKLVSFGLEQWNQRDIVTQELPKKKKKSEDNSSTVRERVNRNLCVEKFSNARISE
jgi:hypothetical protein